MSVNQTPGQTAREFFEDIWNRGDCWDYESSAFELSKYERQIALLGGTRHRRVLEIGCGAGVFTRRLADCAEHIHAVDVSAAAIAKARAAGIAPDRVEFTSNNIMDYHFSGDPTWDLVVMSETIYYLGWLYRFYEVCWLASQLFECTTPGGKLLMANTMRTSPKHYLQLPFIIRTYRDLFLNVGYKLEAEEVFRGEKEGFAMESLISAFVKPG
jgi:SAM-dependent methyltransferase